MCGRGTFRVLVVAVKPAPPAAQAPVPTSVSGFSRTPSTKMCRSGEPGEGAVSLSSTPRSFRSNVCFSLRSLRVSLVRGAPLEHCGAPGRPRALLLLLSHQVAALLSWFFARTGAFVLVSRGPEVGRRKRRSHRRVNRPDAAGARRPRAHQVRQAAPPPGVSPTLRGDSVTARGAKCVPDAPRRKDSPCLCIFII